MRRPRRWIGAVALAFLALGASDIGSIARADRVILDDPDGDVTCITLDSPGAWWTYNAERDIAYGSGAMDVLYINKRGELRYRDASQIYMLPHGDYVDARFTGKKHGRILKLGRLKKQGKTFFERPGPPREKIAVTDRRITWDHDFCFTDGGLERQLIDRDRTSKDERRR